MTTQTVTLEGPLFTHNPGKTFYQNLGDMLSALASDMEDITRKSMEEREGEMRYWTGWTRDHTIGYTTSPVTGKHWSTFAAVATVTAGMSKKDAIRTKAAAASIEGRFHPFRATKSAVYRARALITADLAKGLD